ncbi:MAG TPA: AAA family ATPase [Gemmatimonadaceae bacterium]|nr:AAA family ATPase [Gemmatimonadaceae bacterium]
MDPTINPFAPGAGTRPPELAGRDEILVAARNALVRVKMGRPAKSQMLLGLRGVGKTVLLNEIGRMGEAEGYRVIELEAPEGRRLAEMLVPPLRSVLNRLSTAEKAKTIATKALRGLQSFASTFRVKVGDVQVGMVEPGVADSGHLETDLPELLLLVAAAARAAETPVALLIDEVQYLSEEDLRALIVSAHKIAQRGLPFIVFGAGLPQLAALTGEAKSYSERLFDFITVGRLDAAASERAIREPIRAEGADIEPAALTAIVERTRGYPYFLQVWGKHAWDTAPASPITESDVARATREAGAALDESFFRVRLDRLTRREKDYVRAMAELGPGPHRSGDIAATLGVPVTTVAPLRSRLIDKGMIYSGQYGETDFTVPMFDEFMRRAIPVWTPAAHERSE